MNENKTLEYKENLKSDSFMKTISAFANYGGGQIIFGVADDGNVKGISEPEAACLALENKINDSIKPIPEYILNISEERTICLTVRPGVFKPYCYKGKAYKRSDTSTVEVDRLEFQRLILEGSNRSFEELPCGDSELCFQKLEEALVRTMGISELNRDILKTLALYSDSTGYNQAAALLADVNRFRGIDIVRFGENIDEIMDRESFEGISILKQFEGSIKMFRKYYQYEKIAGVERKTVDLLPEKAFREAIANALVHRTWDVNASIKVSMHPDRIEISSPGGLPVGISEEEYLDGQISILRNPIIGNVFFRLKYIEKFGTGIMRINNAYADSAKKPSYKVYENSINITLPLTQSEQMLDDVEKTIYDILKAADGMTRADIEKAVDISKARAIRLLNGMVEKSIIVKRGAGRSVKYYIG